MEISDKLIDQLSNLARLRFEGEARDRMKSDLQNILHFIDQLNAVDTKGVEPLVFMTPSINVLRDDVAVETITQAEALKNAPNKDSDYFRISKVMRRAEKKA